MLPHRPFGSTGLEVSALGLGGSRLGSILGASAADAEALLEGALALGVTYFDTSDLYGQGDSERLIGKIVARRPGTVIATKVGKRHPLKVRLLAPFKAPLAGLLAARAADTVKRARSKPVPTCFEPAYLAGAIDRGLGRLGVETVDVMMLHSPAADVLRRGDAIATLDRARASGKIRIIGASVDDVAAAEAALADPRVRALQIPLRPGETEFLPIVDAAAHAGVAVVAREIFGGPGSRSKADVTAAIGRILALSGISTALVGTTRLAHLREAVEAARV